DGAYSNYQAYSQAFPIYNEHSFNQNPNFLSNTNHHLNQSLPNLRGVDVGMVTDREGDPRCTFSPTLGMDESTYPSASPTASMTIADSIYENSPTTIYSAFQPQPGIILDYTWYVDGVQKAKTQHLNEVFASGTYQIGLRVRSCGGSDSVASSFTTVNPGSTPVSDFSASNLMVEA